MPISPSAELLWFQPLLLHEIQKIYEQADVTFYLAILPQIAPEALSVPARFFHAHQLQQSHACRLWSAHSCPFQMGQTQDQRILTPVAAATSSIYTPMT